MGLLAPRPADAQIVRIGATNPLVGMPIRGNAVGYDPIHGAYLLVGGNPVVQGVCVNASGMPVSGVITVMGNGGLFGVFPKVKFSPHAGDGAGGLGSFLVEWVQTDAPGATAVHARLVSCAPSVMNAITADQLVSDYAQGGARYEVGGSSIAYSNASHRFLIVYQTVFAGIQARFVDSAGVPFGPVMPIANAGGSQYPGVAWNPATDEFGISYSGWVGSPCPPAAFVGFVRLRAGDGFLFPRTLFGCAGGTYFTDIAVNPGNGRFVMGWSPGGGILFQEFDSVGTGTANAGLMTSVFGGNDNFAIDFNQVSGTFLGVGQHSQSYEIAGVEANTNGFPIGVSAPLTAGGAAPGSYYPGVAGRNDAPQWAISVARQFNTLSDQIIGTSSVNGGPSSPAAPPPTPTPTPTPTPPAGGCLTPNPFAAMGAGVCVNGGWQFGQPAPAPTPTPTPTPTPAPAAGCSTPNPFAAFGMGVCVNGGWIFAAPAAPPPPPPAPTPTPTPTPAPAAGCATPNPFAAFGMGVCVNGGWVFAAPSTPPPPAPAPNPNNDGTCATGDPFGGGGICFQGGWYPPGTPTLCSGLPDPFVAFGGGICVNGGWRMRTEDH
ncbi:MAG TPA: hypothetical protein VJN96_18485 [Vicinamibacterales bacterium]|nr:hypothetical protein [Vicinamibacterales bacterium]